MKIKVGATIYNEYLIQNWLVFLLHFYTHSSKFWKNLLKRRLKLSFPLIIISLAAFPFDSHSADFARLVSSFISSERARALKGVGRARRCVCLNKISRQCKYEGKRYADAALRERERLMECKQLSIHGKR